MLSTEYHEGFFMDRILALFKKIFPRRLFTMLQPLYHFLWAFFSALWYCFPSRKLVVVGVTGTKGKTTVVELIHSILEASGAKVASLSSLRFKIGGREIRNEFKMTMPGRGFVQKFLRDAHKAGCRYAVLEVTSQGIQQFRHRFICFSAAVVTNVAPEHIEAHGSFEKYLRAKLDLFWRLGRDAVAVIPRDDSHAERFAASVVCHKVFYGFSGVEMQSERWRLEHVNTAAGVQFVLVSEKSHVNGFKRIEIASSLEGLFNLSNILAATAFGVSRHIESEKILAGIAAVSGIPGRMEWIQREPFGVVVDYAHTPDSLRNVYSFLKESTINHQPSTTNQLICVLGSAGGGRDRWKRPEMGRVAAEFCDEIILTNEDPYDENPEAILEEIVSGFSPTANRQPPTAKILDRREAIRVALQKADNGDCVIITGKGAEPWIMGRAGAKIPWDDREIARDELKKLSFSSTIQDE